MRVSRSVTEPIWVWSTATLTFSSCRSDSIVLTLDVRVGISAWIPAISVEYPTVWSNRGSTQPLRVVTAPESVAIWTPWSSHFVSTEPSELVRAEISDLRSSMSSSSSSVLSFLA